MQSEKHPSHTCPSPPRSLLVLDSLLTTDKGLYSFHRLDYYKLEANFESEILAHPPSYSSQWLILQQKATVGSLPIMCSRGYP